MSDYTFCVSCGTNTPSGAAKEKHKRTCERVSKRAARSKYAAQRLSDKRIDAAGARAKQRKKRTPPMLQAIAEIKRLRALVEQGYAVVQDFMPNLGRCALQDYGRLNQFLIAARALADPVLFEQDYSGTKRPRCPCCTLEVLQGQPCVYAQVSDKRVTVLHEPCADTRGADGKTFRECLEEKARDYESSKAPKERNHEQRHR